LTEPSIPQSEPRSIIELHHAAGEWHVRIIEAGSESTRSFSRRDYAESFAEGQRLRLRLDSIERL